MTIIGNGHFGIRARNVSHVLLRHAMWNLGLTVAFFCVVHRTTVHLCILCNISQSLIFCLGWNRTVCMMPNTHALSVSTHLSLVTIVLSALTWVVSVSLWAHLLLHFFCQVSVIYAPSGGSTHHLHSSVAISSVSCVTALTSTFPTFSTLRTLSRRTTVFSLVLPLHCSASSISAHMFIVQTNRLNLCHTLSRSVHTSATQWLSMLSHNFDFGSIL